MAGRAPKNDRHAQIGDRPRARGRLPQHRSSRAGMRAAAWSDVSGVLGMRPGAGWGGLRAWFGVGEQALSSSTIGRILRQRIVTGWRPKCGAGDGAAQSPQRARRTGAAGQMNSVPRIAKSKRIAGIGDLIVEPARAQPLELPFNIAADTHVVRPRAAERAIGANRRRSGFAPACEPEAGDPQGRADKALIAALICSRARVGGVPEAISRATVNQIRPADRYRTRRHRAVV